MPSENQNHHRKACAELNYSYEILIDEFCKDYMPKFDPYGGDNLEKRKPEREYKYVTDTLHSRYLRLPGMQVTVTKPAFNRYLQRV